MRGCGNGNEDRAGGSSDKCGGMNRTSATTAVFPRTFSLGLLEGGEHVTTVAAEVAKYCSTVVAAFHGIRTDGLHGCDRRGSVGGLAANAMPAK